MDLRELVEDATRIAIADQVEVGIDLIANGERLWVVPDCGFWATPRAATVGKLTAMVAGARLVRGELRG